MDFRRGTGVHRRLIREAQQAPVLLAARPETADHQMKPIPGHIRLSLTVFSGRPDQTDHGSEDHHRCEK